MPPAPTSNLNVATTSNAWAAQVHFIGVAMKVRQHGWMDGLAAGCHDGISSAIQYGNSRGFDIAPSRVRIPCAMPWQGRSFPPHSRTAAMVRLEHARPHLNGSSAQRLAPAALHGLGNDSRAKAWAKTTKTTKNVAFTQHSALTSLTLCGERPEQRFNSTLVVLNSALTH